MANFVFNRGDELGADNLFIIFRDVQGRPRDVYDVTYFIYDYTDGVNLILISGGTDGLTPVKLGTGEYYATYKIPDAANVGEWRIHWRFRETATGPFVLEKQRFAVVGVAVQTAPGYTEKEAYYIHELRKVLRDNNPSRNYRFQPPRAEEEIQGFTENYGYIWTDDELHNYISWSVGDINAWPTITNYNIENWPENWTGILLVRGGVYALRAIAIHWAGEEFSYSISGVSLDIDKMSKYQSMKENFEADYERTIEVIKTNIVVLRGLQQPHWGIGIGSGAANTSKMAKFIKNTIIRRK